MRMCWRRAFAAPWLWLLEKLAALRGSYILACVRLDHLGNDRVVLLALYGGGECLDEGARSITNSWASASGLSSTMAMSISPPSFLMRAGLPACICSRIAPLCSHIGSVPTLQWLAVLVIQFAAGIARSTAFLVQPGMRWQAVWQLAWLRRPLPLGGCQCLAPRKRLCFLRNGMFRFRP